MTRVVNSLVDFRALEPMRAWWKLLMKVFIIWFVVIFSFCVFLVIVGNRMHVSATWWFFGSGLLFVSVNFMQLAYTARFLRTRSKVLTREIAASVEATLLGLGEREEVLELIGLMIDSAADETFKQIKPFDTPVKLVYQKKGGKAAVLKKVQARFATRYRPRVERIFRKLLAEDKEQEASPAGTPASQRPDGDLQAAAQPPFCGLLGCWDVAEDPTHLAQRDLEMAAAREVDSPDREEGGNSDDDDDIGADISEAVARAGELSMAAQVQAAWRGKKDRARLALSQRSASKLQAVQRGQSARNRWRRDKAFSVCHRRHTVPSSCTQTEHHREHLRL
jgi:hypothetical protein